MGLPLPREQRQAAIDADHLAGGEPHEIHMDRHVLDGVELEVARDDAFALALDLDVEDGGQEAPGTDAQAQLIGVERDGGGRRAA